MPCGGQEKKKMWILTPECPESIINIAKQVELPVKDGYIDISENPELQYMSVLNRYGEDHMTVAVYQGFGLDCGAFATTVSHDTHNLTMVYRSPEDANIAAKEIKKMGGGMCVVKDGQVLGRLLLPVGGLMSLNPCDVVAEEIREFRKSLMKVCDNLVALAHSSVMSLTCLPGLVVTDLGVVDGNSQTFFDIMKVE